MATPDVRARILIVEDDPYIQRLLCYLLRPYFDLELAIDVDEAFSMAAQKPMDLFLIDINLGSGCTGVDLLWALRKMPAYNATPAVSCTAYALGNDRDLFLSYGFDEHMRKPFEPSHLYQVVESMLRQRVAA